jgi:hypothetical protein
VTSESIHSTHRFHLCVSYRSQNKQRLLPYTALTDWFLQPRRSVYCAVRAGSLNIRSAHTVYLCVLCGSQNKQRLFPYTALTDWFLQPRRSVYCAVRAGSLNVNQVKYTVPRVTGHIQVCSLCLNRRHFSSRFGVEKGGSVPGAMYKFYVTQWMLAWDRPNPPPPQFKSIQKQTFRVGLQINVMTSHAHWL